MADIKNKNELKRRIELFVDELDYSINKDYCMETMRMMREFIGYASHRLDCANSKIKSLMAKLREYQKLEEQGLLLRLPCSIGTTVYYVQKCQAPSCKEWLGFTRVNNCYCDFKSRIFEQKFDYRHLGAFGHSVFLTKKEAEQALKQMGE